MKNEPPQRDPCGEKIKAVMASGHGLPARLHNETAHTVSAHCDFSRAEVQPMLCLHPSRPQALFLIVTIGVLILFDKLDLKLSFLFEL